MNPATVSVRRMMRADLEQVIEIAESLKEAPLWARAAYLAAVEAEGAPARIALVAEEVEEEGLISSETLEKHPSRAKARIDFEPVTARLKSCPVTKPGDSAAGGGMVGFAIGRLVGPEAELETIGVACEAQRSGVAGRLFSALAEELRRMQVEELLLEVRASNRPALGFYRSRGFEETGRRPDYYAEPIEDALLMRLRL
jgi:ribosomal-protein-alanine acetyltransferase